MRRTVALAFAISLSAQDPRFDVQSRLVLVPATVTDTKGRSIDGLEASDFVVLDNGRPQQAVVDTIGTGVAPIALVVAVQSSGISAAALEKVRKIGAMIPAMLTGERGCAALVTFDDRVEWRQDCTNDQSSLAGAFLRLQAGDGRGARMLDAAYEAIKALGKRPNVRRVLLLISESRDRGSETDLETVAVAAQTAGVAIYAATFSAFKTGLTEKTYDHPPPLPEKPPALGKEVERPSTKAEPRVPPPHHRVDILAGIGELARLGKTIAAESLTVATGGASFSFTRLKGLEDAIQKLGSELHTQYVLSFTPESPAAGFHRIEVRVSRPGTYRIRARPGYWAQEAR